MTGTDWLAPFYTFGASLTGMVVLYLAYLTPDAEPRRRGMLHLLAHGDIPETWSGALWLCVLLLLVLAWPVTLPVLLMHGGFGKPK